MSRLLAHLLPRPSHLRRNRARQWQQAARRVELFRVLNFNMAAGQLAAGW